MYAADRLDLSCDMLGVLLQTIKGFQKLYLVVFLLEEETRDYHDIPTIFEVLTMYFYATKSVALPPMIEGTFMCLSIVLLVNS